ncbi:MAG: hypothetical protein LBC93_08310 [Synergistaceae bacterium]|nr:hypothetical protein [Synergistaceae bacterium]
MESERVFIPCTVAGLNADGNAFGVLADTFTADEHADYAETAVYFEGDFNSNAVVLPWETENDDHAEQVEIARGTLRRHKLFLRTSNK